MFLIYIDTVKLIIPCGMSIKIYANDVKLYGKAINPAEREAIQRTMIRFDDWCRSLDLQLHVEKCGVLHMDKLNLRSQYFVNGQAVKSVRQMKDLGVLTMSSLKY